MAMHTLTLPDGAMNSLVVHPTKPRGGAVIVIQEIFGVNAPLRAACDMVADMGFTAVAPDLFWRLGDGIDLDSQNQSSFQEALALLNRFDQSAGIADLKAAVAFARSLPGTNGKVGTIGFCLGGRLAMMMAQHSDADINVSYYGVGLDTLLDRLDAIHAPLLLHVAGEDGFFPPAGRAALLNAVAGHPNIQAWNYPGADHAFARVGGAHYDGLMARIAHGRTAAALAAALAA